MDVGEVINVVVVGTGQQISFTEIGIIRIEDDKVAEMWAISDSMGFMQQIGLMPSPDDPDSG